MLTDADWLLEAAVSTVLEFRGADRRILMLHWGLDGADPLTVERTARAVGVDRVKVRSVVAEAERRIGARMNRRTNEGDAPP